MSTPGVTRCDNIVRIVLDFKSTDSNLCVTLCVNDNTMATNLSIDAELLDKALELGGEKTKKATVNKALREFVVRREQARLLDLFGEFDWDDEFDYKRERTR